MLDDHEKTDQEVIALLKALGKAYLENNENQKAADKFRQLIDQGIADTQIYRDFALALARSEALHPEALTVYRCAVKENKDDETLYLTLATLFLREEITEEPALRVYRRALKYAPPFAEQLQLAIENIFQTTTDTITVPELRQTLLESADSPDLLNLYLSTAWQNERFDETISILKDLYVKSERNPMYLRALCETFLEKKARADLQGRPFSLAYSDAQYCLRYQPLDGPLESIRAIEGYLDLRDLLLSLPAKTLLETPDEYELLLSDESLQRFDEVVTQSGLRPEIATTFDLVRDFLNRLQVLQPATEDQLPHPDLQAASLNTIAVLELVKHHSGPVASSLPFKTFLQLVGRGLGASRQHAARAVEDGMVILSAAPQDLLTRAVDILKRLERYNEVVEEEERIKLQMTLHRAQLPFMESAPRGLLELRKAFKLHNRMMSESRWEDPANATKPSTLFISDVLLEMAREWNCQRAGRYKLLHFPGQYEVHRIVVREHPKITASAKEKFGKYSVTQVLKESDWGSTLVGYDPQLEREVIIKTYKATASAGNKPFSEMRKQFYEEIRRLNRVQNPSVALIYDAGEQGETLYLVREFVDGKTVDQATRPDGDISETVQLFVRICKILDSYHQHDIWHKNLKPSNIFVTDYNEVKLVDGGLLQSKQPHQPRADEVEALAYAAPEQIQGKKLTASCDVFQLGIILYEALTGVRPFNADAAADLRAKILTETPPAASSRRFEIPRRLDQIIERALAAHPDARYRSIEELETALREQVQSPASSARKKMLELFK